MGLLDDVQELAAAGRRGPACGFVHVQLDPADMADLTAALADVRVPNRVISEVLKRRNYDIQPATVSRHRKGECRCVREAAA